MQTVNLSCSGCGAPVDPGAKRCEYCRRAIVLSGSSEILNTPEPLLRDLMRQYEQGNVAERVAAGAAGGAVAPQRVDFSIGLCCLKLKLYDKAAEKFDAAIDDTPGSADVYFYGAIARLGGRKAFLSPMPVIRKVMEYLEAARSLEDKGLYSFFMGYVKYDFFARKFLKISPDYKAEVARALQIGVTQNEADMLFSLLNVEFPEKLLEL